MRLWILFPYAESRIPAISRLVAAGALWAAIAAAALYALMA